MEINKEWAMPSKNTFSIKPIEYLVSTCFLTMGLTQPCFAVDPFVGNSPFKDRCLSNDLNPEITADEHKDALVFLRTISPNVVDILLFDPPYSPRQVSECYKKMKRTVNMQTTQSIFWSNLKKEVTRIVRPGGMVITCGWNSGGIGKKYRFKQTEILLVSHGSWHNDTIVSIEEKT